MKRLARRHLQQQLQKQTSQPFFKPGNNHALKSGEKPFFQKQSKTGETEEKDTVQTMGAEEDKKENLPVMRQTDGQEDKEQQAKQ